AEALACGTPVLALERGGLSEVVGPGAGRLVPVREDGRALQEEEVVARGAAALPEVVALSREDCRAYAVAHHSLDRMVDHYVRVYEETVGVRSPGPGTGQPLRRPLPPRPAPRQTE